MEDGGNIDEVNTWRQVHSTLFNAVIKAQEAVAIQKAQRRFWLEEIAYNLDDAGQPASHSLWKRPIRAIATIKAVRKKKDPVTTPPLDSSTPTLKKRKSTKAPLGTAGTVTSNTENDDSILDAVQPTKKRRKKTEDLNDNLSSLKKPKQAKLVIKRAASTKQQAEKFPTTTTSATGRPFYNDDGDGDDDISEEDFDDEDDMAAIEHEPQPLVSRSHPNQSSMNDSNWAHDNDDNDSYHDTIPHQRMLSTHDDDDDNDNDDVSQPPSPPRSSFLASSTHSSNPAPAIRNYTSLQDIAMNEDDSDDEDRF
jgi:hypothetical protein